LHRVWAAEDLGPAHEATVTDALAGALDAVDFDDDAELGFAHALIHALAGRDQARAITAILRALRKSLGHDVLPAAACDALTRTRAKSALADLQELFESAEDNARELAEAIVAIAGESAIPFFRRALNGTDSRSQHAAAALGALGDHGAVPLLEAQARCGDKYRAGAAVNALVRLDAPSAGPLALAILDGDDYSWKLPIANALGSSRRHDVAEALLERAGNPDAGPELRAALLEATCRLGDARGRRTLGEMCRDESESPCAQGWAALALLRLGDGDAVRFLAEFLGHDRGHKEADPRDAYSNCVVLQGQIVTELESFARTVPEALVRICDVFHQIRQDGSGLKVYAQTAAQHAVESLTGTETYSEYRAWRTNHVEPV
jgi:HEAT repeat protein